MTLPVEAAIGRGASKDVPAAAASEQSDMHKAFIASLFEHLLFRQPSQREIENWVDVLSRGIPDREVFRRFVNSKEYAEKHRVQPGFPSGHFYSPVVDPEAVRDYWTASSQVKAADLLGINFSLDEMTAFWLQNQACIEAAPFTEEPTGHTRYYYNDGRYPKGDAIVLMAMINASKPKQIIEIGSGFSSAVMLDTADMLGVHDFRLTCIDPYADRLRSLLRPHDHDRVRILEQTVQTVPVDVFGKLVRGDILFIDSSHVLKTGSDVHYELFSILPTLAPGVLVHFHDIQFPFEYPAQWVFGKRWSWNEIYAVRAFLMFNKRFRVKFFTDYFIREQAELVAALNLGASHFIGGSLWLECSEQ